MKKFIVIYHTTAEAMSQRASATAEDQAKSMEKWMNWAQRCGDKLVDMGAPLMGGTQLSQGGRSAASSKDVSGYSVLQAASREDAISLLDGHPHLSGNPDSTIEIHEAVSM